MTIMTRVWPDGALFVYQATSINGAAISTVTTVLTPGAANEFELFTARISHNDATASDIDIFIRDDGARTLAVLADIDSVNQNEVIAVPAPGTAPAVGGNFPTVPHPILIAGTMDLYMAAIDIDATEGTTVSIMGRVIGGLPDIVEEAGGTPTITINTERVF